MFDTQRRFAIAAMAAAMLAAVSAAAYGQTAPDGAKSITPASAPSMHPGDLLRLRIYREPDLSGDFQVNERGAVVLPRLGEVRIADWPTDSLQPRLTRAFAEYLRNPTVEVTPLRRIAVTGAVLKPNLYQVDPTMTVMDALAMAGGSAPDGVRDRVELRRNNQRLVASLDQRSLVADLRLQSGDQLFVPQRSWLSRNTWLVSTVIGAAVTFTTVMVAR